MAVDIVMDKRLLNILRCPQTHKGLRLASGNLLADINAAIAAGNVANHSGDILTEALSEALITEDQRRLYPVVDGIPVLLEPESVSLSGLAETS